MEAEEAAQQNAVKGSAGMAGDDGQSDAPPHRKLTRRGGL